MSTTDVTECPVRNDKVYAAGFFSWSWLAKS